MEVDSLIQAFTPRLFLSACVYLFVLRCVVTYSYRWFCSPLARIPGPFFARLSDWYGVYHAALGQFHLAAFEAHQRYGSIYRPGPTKLLFNTRTAYQTIYNSKSVQKATSYAPIMPAPGVYNIHTAVDKSTHRFKRRLISQGLTDHCMRKFEPSLNNHVDKYIENLSGLPREGEPTDESLWSIPVNMTPRFRWLAYDIMGQFGFGQSFQMQEKPDNHFLITGIAASNKRANVYAQFPALSKTKLDRILYPWMTQLRLDFVALMTAVVKERLRAGNASQNDLFSFISDVKDAEEGRGFSEAELGSETRFLLVAGTDTSSSVLSSLFYYLSQYTDCYTKLAAEIRGAFEAASDIRSGPRMTECVYLRACIDEALRMTPPVGGALWREVTEGGMEIDGRYVPAGFDVGCSIYCLHHNEVCFPDSFTFNPDRWIVSEKNPLENVKRAREAFVPFSVGSRSCVGKSMAYMEVSDVVARTLWHFDFKAADEPPTTRRGSWWFEGPKSRRNRAEFLTEDQITSVHTGPYLQFRQREG